MSAPTHLRNGIAAAFVAVAAAAALAGGQQTQTPPPPPQQQQPPVFRTGADVIRLDVSVLDKNRRPVRGLELEDFSVTEDGTPQRVVAIAAVDVAEHDPAPSAWMRHVPPDISTNDLVDQVGDGRLFAIVMDDVNIPWDDLEIIQGARMAARYIVDSLGPSDIAAVVFPRDAGLTVDFTSDRRKLLEAIDQFDPREPDMFVPMRPSAPGGGGGDMPYRWSPILMRNECERSQPTVPTLDILASRLATVPNRRKSIILVSTGIPLNLGASRDCPGDLAYTMREMFRRAQQANINVHSVDPAGFRGYEQYLMNPIRRGGRPARTTMSQPAAEGAAKFRREFLEITADYTGAHAVVGREAMETGIDRIFEENESYYLLGYQTSNGKPDGKFRRVVVKVNRSGVTVRTRSGFFAPQTGSLVTREQKAAPTSNDLSLSGLNTPTGLPLRASLVSIAPAAGAPAGSRDVDVAVALSVRLPPGRAPLTETLTVIRNVYVNGSPGPPAARDVSDHDRGDLGRRDPLRSVSEAVARAGPLRDPPACDERAPQQIGHGVRRSRGAGFHACARRDVGHRAGPPSDPRHAAQGRARHAPPDRPDERPRLRAVGGRRRLLARVPGRGDARRTGDAGRAGARHERQARLRGDDDDARDGVRRRPRRRPRAGSATGEDAARPPPAQHHRDAAVRHELAERSGVPGPLTFSISSSGQTRPSRSRSAPAESRRRAPGDSRSCR